MLNLIDFDILRRVMHCIYNRSDDFGTIFTTRNGQLERITFRDDFENRNGIPRFSIDRGLTVESHDGTDRNIIINCFRQNGIHAN
jgi:hypothetical protein